ncbi:MAG TPA: DUF1553 domain-containing protein, partial [Candidatus Acidoferrum sp.]|nr:DUF1553 domain-containing protein [Candidatus Acidoferrum sp.]
GCARCHDHKFDPIPTRDYYAMAGILRSTRTITNANVSGWIERPLPVESAQEELYQKHEAQLAVLQTKIKTVKDFAKTSAGKTGEPSTRKSVMPSIVAATNLPGVVVDSSLAKAVGEWKLSQFSKRFIGDGYLHDEARDKGTKTLTFIPELKKPGRYEVRFAYVHSPSRATNVPLTVFHADGETTVTVNEQEAPVLDDRFVSLGQFRFEANGFGYVLVANEGTTGHVTADAVQFLPVEEAEIASRREGDLPRAAKEEVASASEIKALEAELKKLRETRPKRPLAMSVEEGSDIGDTYIHVRGSVHNLGAKVPRGFLQVASVGAAPVLPEKQSGRVEFADWLASSSNPLTARVLANRVWHWLMGSGLVRTPDNFGTTGEAPSHPELLDHLALRFQEQGWSVKKLVREIVLSRTYQLATGAAEFDPENHLHARANRRRLDAECIRDAMLFVSGELKLDVGGSTIKPGTGADYGYQFTEPRRSVYVPALRNALPEIFEVFDFANPSSVVGARNVSTVAPQALFLMNHPFVSEQANLAAQRVLRDAPTAEARIELIYARALGRKPSVGEAAIARNALQEQGNEIEAWTAVVHAIFASADFRYVN